MTTDTSAEAVERLLENVTPGPWSEHDAGKHPYVFVCGPDQLYYNGEVKDKPLVAYVTGVGAIKNRAFIAAARELVPALLKERDEARARAAAAYEMAAEFIEQRNGEIPDRPEDRRPEHRGSRGDQGNGGWKIPAAGKGYRLRADRGDQEPAGEEMSTKSQVRKIIKNGERQALAVLVKEAKRVLPKGWRLVIAYGWGIHLLDHDGMDRSETVRLPKGVLDLLRAVEDFYTTFGPGNQVLTSKGLDYLRKRQT